MRTRNGRKVFSNQVNVEGYVYEHNLDLKITGETSKHPGTEYITGSLSIATDDELTNVIQVYFRYVTATTAAGKPNETFNILNSIIEGKIGSVMEHGAENAGKVRISTSIGLNEFYSARNNGELVSVKRNEGGFIHQVTELNGDPKKRSTFSLDMVITKATRVEEDEERGYPEKLVLKGCIFDYKNALLPVEFNVYNPSGMAYFEGLEPSNKKPVFTLVRGVEVAKTVVRHIEEESAFGEPLIREYHNTQRDFVVDWAQPETYEWDDESTITANEFTEMIANREIHLAELKRDYDARQSSKGSAFKTSSKDSYDF